MADTTAPSVSTNEEEAPPGFRWRPDLIVPVVLVVGAFMLFAGFSYKASCFGPQTGQQFSTGCYNDVQFLWGVRNLHEHVFPYVHGGLVDGNVVGGTVEYPVLTGVFIWLTALPAHSADSFLVWSAFLLLPFGLLTEYLLARMVGWRALLFAAAPAVVLYAVHNWDLLVVAATVGAFYAWWRERYGWAAFWLGIGACLKFYPVFLLAPLVLDHWSRGDRRGALRSAMIGIGTIYVVNVPFILVNADGWWAPYKFQKLRNADFSADSIWTWGAQKLTTNDLNKLTPVLIACAFAVALGVGWWRSRREGEFPFIQVCGAMVLAFVLLGKVFSPQYALWVLPFLALIRVRWGWWVAFIAADVALYFSLFRWYYDVTYLHHDFLSLGLANQGLIVAIWMRALVVALLFVVFLCSRTAIAPRHTALAQE